MKGKKENLFDKKILNILLFAVFLYIELYKKNTIFRSDMEKFFIEALDHVHRQIRSSRASYVKAAGSEYHQKMAKAAAGKGPLPPVKTFGANPNSKNSVQQDLQQAEDWKYVTPTTDISELTWEQKGD